MKYCDRCHAYGDHDYCPYDNRPTDAEIRASYASRTRTREESIVAAIDRLRKDHAETLAHREAAGGYVEDRLREVLGCPFGGHDRAAQDLYAMLGTQRATALIDAAWRAHRAVAG